jgi:glucosyl-dolichyl phosphate glucuronosyltransferase
MNSSVIVPTSGRPVAIRRALRSLLDAHAHEHAEILVVDNNEEESMRADLQAICAAAGTGAVRYVAELSPGLSAARHRGAREARGEILLFLDDDVEVSEGWLHALAGAFDDPSVAIAGGPSIPRFTSSVPAWLWDFLQPAPYGGWGCGWLSLLDIGRTVDDIDPNMIWGLNFAIRRSVLMSLQGFHPDVVPAALQRWQGDGESGLTMKAQAAGHRAVYVQEALLSHIIEAHRLTPAYFMKRAYYQGVCDSFGAIRGGISPAADADVVLPPLNGSQDTGRWTGFAAAVWQGMSAAYREAWLFHQGEAARDTDLLRWIRREHYMDADIRDEIRRRPPSLPVV